MKKLLSLLLAFLLVLGLLPLNPLPAYATVSAICSGTYTWVAQAGGEVYLCTGGGSDWIKIVNTSGEDSGYGANQQSYYPKNMAISGGLLYCLDKNNQVTAFTGYRNFYQSYNMGLSYPQGIAVDSNGNIYVTDNGQVVKRSTSGAVTRFGSLNDSLGIAAATVDGNVRIFVTSKDYVYQFNADGGLIGTYSGFSKAYGIAADSSGNAYVSDYSDGSVKKINSSGQVTTIATGFRYPCGIAADNSGNIFVADNGNHVVKKISRSNTSFMIVADPSSACSGTAVTLKVGGLMDDSTGTVTLSVDGTSMGSKTVAGNSASWTTDTDLDTGTHTIQATYSGDSNYNSATYSGSFKIGNSLTSVKMSSIGSDTLTASVDPPGATVSYLWLSGYNTSNISSNRGTASTFTLAADDKDKYFRVCATGTGSFAGQVYSEPVQIIGPQITTSGSNSFKTGIPGTYTIKATGFPIPALTLTGTLPEGLSFKDNNDGTATISGTPATGTANSYSLNITASNAVSQPAMGVYLLVEQSYTASFNSKGGSTVAQVIGIGSGEKLTKPVDPTKAGYAFDGWYKEESCTNSWNFDTDTVTGDTTLYAKWIACSVSVGSQSGTLTAGQEGSAAFAVTTTNIEDGTTATASWCDASGNSAETPTGLSANASNVFSNSSTVTVAANGSAAAGTYYFKFTSNGTVSGVTALTVKPKPVAPTITGSTSLELTEGYEAISTGVYTITGTAPVTVTKTSGDAKIAWNDATKKLDIAAGLAAGSYPVVLTASNGTAPNDTLTFTLTVKPKPVAPTITGSTSLELTEDYEVTSTGVYTVTGTAPVTVSKTSGNDKITWNDATKKLDIAAGLAAGSYPVTLTASNGTAPNDTLTFTLTVKTKPVAPTITGSTSLELTEGYEAISTGVYTITGTAPVTVTKTSGDAKITWNDATKKLDIAAGLAAGSYPVELTASNSVSNATLTFTLTVKPKPVAPSITGATAMEVTEGYTATSTDVYTITGTVPVTVIKTSGDDKITWNDATKKLDIAAGLAAGSYPVVLTASNSVSNAALTFTLTVKPKPVAPSITGPTAMEVTEDYEATSTGAYAVTGTVPVTVTKTSGNDKITWNDATKKLDIAAGLAAGSYPVVLTVSNSVSNATLTFTLTVKPKPVAPSITGPTAMEVTEGYTATSTDVYTITGTAPVTVTKTSGNNKITWNDATRKLDIATGLSAGSYPIVLTASNSVSNAALIFTLTVKPKPVTPSITGPTAMEVTEGYAAASTDVYTITGTAPVTVTKTSGDTKITWNDATKKLDIATGLSAGSYPIVLTASNSVSNAALTFTLTVKPAPVTLRSIAITKYPKQVYTVGDKVDITGLEVTGTYSDNSKRVETVTAANITGFNSSKAVASQTLTVTVNGKVTTYTVKIEAAPVTLESIAITKYPKQVYTVGDKLDISGLEVTGTYSDNSKKVETVTAANITCFNSSKAVASQTLTVTVNGKATTYTVKIEAAPVTLESIAITKPATKTVYTVGDQLDITGLEVTGTYSDNSQKSETVTAANITGFDSTKPVKGQTLTVTVSGKTTSYTVEIQAEKETGNGVISEFSNLADSVKSRTVALGTEISSINLPQKLKAVVDGISNVFVSVAKWVSSVTYNPNTAGTYDFTPVLDSGYQVKDSGVHLPHITVKVTSGGNNTPSDGSHSSRSGSKSVSEKKSSGSTQTSVNASSNTSTVSTVADSTAVNGNTAEITATVLNVTTDTTGTNASLDTNTKASVEIDLPKDAVIQQLSAKKDVDLTVTVPSDVVKNSNANVAVDIKVDSDILAAAKAAQSDVTVNIRDAGTQQLAYSWTFKGEDLAKSTAPVANVNIAMSVHLTTEVPAVNAATPKNSGMVLSFDHSGQLPAVASVRISAAEKGFKPGQTLYFYYYNPETKQIEPLGNSTYTVDADGYVTVQISHCSDYVLLPKAARSISLDTKSYFMAPKNSYEIGVKLTGADGAVLKAYSSTREVANVTVLKNGNVKVTGVKSGSTYIMIDVYDKNSKKLTHASVKLTVQNGVKPNGISERQYGTF